jgi:hypothetical protein
MKTKKSGVVEDLKEKHKKRLARARQELKKRMAMPGQCFDSYISDVLLFSKWAYRVGKGWYGFNLGDVPRVWTDMLDDFLSWLETQCPNFEIHQIKMKMGGLRFYIETNSKNRVVNKMVRAEISALESLLRHKNLIY